MGYDLHITRRQHWCDPDSGADIAPAEWYPLVAHDPELRHAPELGEGMVLWSGPSTHELPWLAWSDGNISTKNPDPVLIGKMVAIATALGARVQGDDGEIYVDGSGEPQPEAPPPAEALPLVASPPPAPGFWQRLRQWRG